MPSLILLLGRPSPRVSRLLPSWLRPYKLRLNTRQQSPLGVQLWSPSWLGHIMVSPWDLRGSLAAGCGSRPARVLESLLRLRPLPWFQANRLPWGFTI